MGRSFRRVLFSAVFWIPAAFASSPRARSPEVVRVERLASLCKLWGSVKFFHPFLAYRDLDWDAALVRAIPKVNAARTAQDYSAAIQGMLDALHDSATHLVEKSPANPERKAERDPRWSWTEDKVLVITINNYGDLMDFPGTADKFQAIQKEMGKARALLFDLRSRAPLEADTSGLLAFSFAFSGIQKSLSSAASFGPSERFRMHVGFSPQAGATSGDYYSGFSVRDGQRFDGEPSAPERPVVFLINRWSELPPIALALQAARKGFLVTDGKAGDGSVVRTHRMRLADDTGVQVRLSELVYEDGSSGLHVDAEVPVGQVGGDRARDVALDLLRNPPSGAVDRKSIVAGAVPPPEKAYPEMKYPEVEYRLLAVFRIWNVFHYFFPYRDLMGEDWEAVLREFIPRVEQARDARDYALILAEMVTHVHDSHVGVTAEALSEYFGVAPSSILVRLIEGVPIVVGFVDREAAEGVSIGDQILTVDGEEAGARFQRYAKYTSASTPQGSIRSVEKRFLNGPDGSTLRLTVRDAANRERSITLTRRAVFANKFEGWRTGEIFKILPGKIGYVDLERLTVPMVDAMFERLKDTKAIVFDMRGYPQGTAWSIAPRLTERHAVPAARFERVVLLEPEDEGGDRGSPVTTDSFIQRLPPTDKWRYKGKTVMLIDERAISQSEHTGLFFEAANGTKFIGSPTAGANGDVTSLLVPGGIRITFTGQSVRHADGRQLQRVGLVPVVEVRPTIAGIRAGRDEVLEKAIEFVQQSPESAKGATDAGHRARVPPSPSLRSGICASGAPARGSLKGARPRA